MKKLPGNLLGVAAIVFLLSIPPAFSHTTVTGTVPRDGAVLDESPPAVEIRFAHAARLTSMVLLGEDKSERRLEFTPAGSAVSFASPEPGLKPGRNEIQWKALSDDGHVIDGSWIIVIKPDVAKME